MASRLREGDRYEVYVDVVHHHKHADDEVREQDTFRVHVASERDPLSVVADCLRDFADKLDERVEESRGS